MEQLDLQGLLKESAKVCTAISRANVGNIKSESKTIKQMFDDDLLAFGVFLLSADGPISDNAATVICECMGKASSKVAKAAVLRHRRLGESHAQQVPFSLKYAVLAAAGKKFNPDPFKGQSAMVFYDTFKLFGRTLLVKRADDVSDAASSRFTAYTTRMEQFIKEYAVWYAGTQKYYRAVEPAEVSAKTEQQRQEKLEELLAQLDELVGLEAVKRQVHDLVNLTQVQRMRQELGMKTTDVTKHMVFSGNPGTGKTTVARMLAQIYFQMGVLSQGQLVEVDRSGLVRGYVGQTATRVQEVVEQALGGVLFVDEAYALTVGKGDNDFGQEAVDTLLKAMEDNRGDLVVIAAGYTELMEEFLNSNPGLRSRFSNFIHFDDYSAEELLAILHLNLKQREYVLSPAAEERAKELIERRVANKPDNFANARDVRNMLDHAISNHATRVVKLKDARGSKVVLGTIEPEDIDEWE